MILEEIFASIQDNIKVNQSWTINMVFESDEIIQVLNKEYRNIDSTTDVLSFHYFDDFSWLKNSEIAWEIVLSFEKIKKQSKEYWNTLEEETYKLIIHSILHILWFDHEDEDDFVIMNKLEKTLADMLTEKFQITLN